MHPRRLPSLFLAGVTLLFLLRQILHYTDLNLLTIVKGNTNYSRTKIIFAYSGNPATIWDQYNKLYQIYSGFGSGSPNSISVANGIRLVTFTEPVILKSSADYIEIGLDYAKYAGYLGVQTDARKFLVDAQGKVQPVKAEYPEPEF